MKSGYAQVEVDCPACHATFWTEVEYLIGSGKTPRTHIQCDDCHAELTTVANLDVLVEKA